MLLSRAAASSLKSMGSELGEGEGEGPVVSDSRRASRLGRASSSATSMDGTGSLRSGERLPATDAALLDWGVRTSAEEQASAPDSASLVHGLLLGWGIMSVLKARG